MKVVLFDIAYAFLIPGGKTTHALKLHQELSGLGIDVEFARWWDESQKDCDIIHFLAPIIYYPKLAKEKGKKTVISLIFDFESNKSSEAQLKTRVKNKLIDTLPFTKGNSYWHSLPYYDKVIFMHRYDKETALRYFPRQLNENKTTIIPHAYDPADMFISDHLNIADMGFPSKYLISCAHIAPRKQSVLLARYAKKAQVPVVFTGAAGDSESYFKEFQEEIDNRYVFYPGYVGKEQKDCIEQNASGFVLLSLGESGCIAVYEAAAYRLPLLLSDLPWAWGYDTPTDISFCDYKNSGKAVMQLKEFYDKAEKLDRTPFKIHTWSEVAQLYSDLYREILQS